ncbi:MAG TPA: hypothetical protein VGF39_11875 [Stellaceae bacterium]
MARFSRRGKRSLGFSLTARWAIWCEIKILTLPSWIAERTLLVARGMAIYQREVENPEHVVREFYGAGGDTDPMRPLPANCASAPSRIRRTGRLAPALFCGS